MVSFDLLVFTFYVLPGLQHVISQQTVSKLRQVATHMAAGTWNGLNWHGIFLGLQPRGYLLTTGGWQMAIILHEHQVNMNLNQRVRLVCELAHQKVWW